MKIAGVRFKENWKVYDFDASNVAVAVGDRVIVESERGQGFGRVVRLREVSEQEVLARLAMEPQKPQRPQKPQARHAPPEEEVEIEIDIDEAFPPAEEAPPAPAQPSPDIKRVLRTATEEDLRKEDKNRGREQEAFTLCQDMIAERELPMKLIRVEYAFDASRATFFFFSETRVDFRELVKELAHSLRTRIEMRQIGVRDVARLVGGFGPCGRELCCASFLRNFEPVSIRMAKKQEMVLNPAKISGVCGRLLCCLSYEYEFYDEIKKDIAGMKESVVREKKEVEERRLAQERAEAEERRLAEEKRRQEEQRRQQEVRQRQREQQREGRKPEKRGEPGQEKKAQPPQEGRQQERQKERQKPDQRQQPQQKQDQKPAQQQGEKSGQGKGRNRFWRKRKKKQRDGKPQGPSAP